MVDAIWLGLVGAMFIFRLADLGGTKTFVCRHSGIHTRLEVFFFLGHFSVQSFSIQPAEALVVSASVGTGDIKDLLGELS